MREPTLLRQCIAEIAGTFILVFFGVGAVHAAVLTGAQSGLWQVAVVWGIGIALAIYAIGAISGAHINPAVTVSMAVFRGFPWAKVAPYLGAQLVGAFGGAAVLYCLFSGALEQFEAAHNLTRGQPGSELAAMCYGEYFPNPAIASALQWNASAVSHVQAMLAEGIGAAFLVFFVFALTDERNRGAPGRAGTPFFIGLGVAIIISIVAPLTQAGLNPARDFGPRLFAWLAGWGDIAIPGPRGGFLTVYVLAPLAGGLIGAAIYTLFIRPGHAEVIEPPEGRLPAVSDGERMRR